jgi:hypothetical protein
MSKAKETWERLAAEAKDDDRTSKVLEALDIVDKSLKGSEVHDEDRAFRQPYSSRPKYTNGRWK